MTTYQFRNSTVYIETGEYRNGRTALQLTEFKTREPYLMATINMSDMHLQAGEICIKDHSENEGVLEFLVNNNITSPSKRSFTVGHFDSRVHVVDLLITEF